MKRIFMAGMGWLLANATLQAQSDSAMMTTPNGKIGKMSVTAFQQANAKGGEMVAAIQPTNDALTVADQKLMMKVAEGGQRQLALSQAAVDKLQSAEAKLLAQSEVEEQTAVAAKLKEVADAKGVTLPEGPDAATKQTIAKMDGMSGGALDAFYVQESGVKGHVKLQTTMTAVKGTAKDPALKALAAATLPVIKMHLTVATDVSKKIAVSNLKKSTAAR